MSMCIKVFSTVNARLYDASAFPKRMILPRIVIPYMFSSSYYSKILDLVVASIPVYVMNNFIRPKWSAYGITHYKAMLRDISILVCVWMIAHPGIAIASLISYPVRFSHICSPFVVCSNYITQNTLGEGG